MSSYHINRRRSGLLTQDATHYTYILEGYLIFGFTYFVLNEIYCAQQLSNRLLQPPQEEYMHVYIEREGWTVKEGGGEETSIANLVPISSTNGQRPPLPPPCHTLLITLAHYCILQTPTLPVSLSSDLNSALGPDTPVPNLKLTFMGRKQETGGIAYSCRWMLYVQTNRHDRQNRQSRREF